MAYIKKHKLLGITGNKAGEGKKMQTISLLKHLIWVTSLLFLSLRLIGNHPLFVSLAKYTVVDSREKGGMVLGLVYIFRTCWVK